MFSTSAIKQAAGLAPPGMTTQEEKNVYNLLTVSAMPETLTLGDQRLNQVAALTYNVTTAAKIFAIIEWCLSPERNSWMTLQRTVVMLHTIVLFGSPQSVDLSIKMAIYVNKIKDYNSSHYAKVGLLGFGKGGTDYGAPVRAAAKILNAVLLTDDSIRAARLEARNKTGADGNDSSVGTLVPMGDFFAETTTAAAAPRTGMGFGQGAGDKALGAGFDLMAVPGMYENRPARYFDSQNDVRARHATGDAQYTRDVMIGSTLLDDWMNDLPPVDNSIDRLPPAEYLPAAQKQKELEEKLAEQQEQLRQMQAIYEHRQKQQPQQQQQQHQQQPSYNDDLLELGMSSDPNPQQQQQPSGMMFGGVGAGTGMGMGMGMGLGMGMGMGNMQMGSNQGQFMQNQQQQQPSGMAFGMMGSQTGTGHMGTLPFFMGTQQQQPQMGIGIGYGTGQHQQSPDSGGSAGSATNTGMGIGMGMGEGTWQTNTQRQHQPQTLFGGMGGNGNGLGVGGISGLGVGNNRGSGDDDMPAHAPPPPPPHSLF